MYPFQVEIESKLLAKISYVSWNGCLFTNQFSPNNCQRRNQEGLGLANLLVYNVLYVLLLISITALRLKMGVIFTLPLKKPSMLKNVCILLKIWNVQSLSKGVGCHGD